MLSRGEKKNGTQIIAVGSVMEETCRYLYTPIHLSKGAADVHAFPRLSRRLDHPVWLENPRLDLVLDGTQNLLCVFTSDKIKHRQLNKRKESRLSWKLKRKQPRLFSKPVNVRRGSNPFPYSFVVLTGRCAVQIEFRD